ncbi:hypothetical protein BvCmsNSNP013_01406 [Escherichia coli]|uniref:hypothetical protein n=1 Tax=Escherichia coli TaxID=562 RepID=UPI0010EF1C13|nr:hypothetical protein [Escherichia coli]GDM35438.1 hypothetical protein BvCmsNSNP013_01406 [Escherichia coli]
MAHSDGVYVIYDKLIKADVFMLMAQHDGIARGNLHSFCNRMQRTDFTLYRVTAYDFVDQQMVPVDVERVYICDAHPSFLEAENGSIEA